jgi:hypothetical protein
MKDYSDGKIYCIRSHQTDDIYIGSTIQPLARRMGNHRKEYKHWLNGKHHYITSFDLLKYEDCYIELLEDYPCETKEQLHKKEGEYIRKMKCVNKNIAGRTTKEHREDNKEKIKEYGKQYYEKNKQKISERIKKYSENNRDKLNEQSKKYKENNREKIKQQNRKSYINNKEKKRQYYQDNREKINQTITCICGSIISKQTLPRHKKTIKHQKFLNN